jgi:hypothetical protein
MGSSTSSETVVQHPQYSDWQNELAAAAGWRLPDASATQVHVEALRGQVPGTDLGRLRELALELHVTLEELTFAAWQLAVNQVCGSVKHRYRSSGRHLEGVSRALGPYCQFIPVSDLAEQSNQPWPELVEASRQALEDCLDGEDFLPAPPDYDSAVSFAFVDAIASASADSCSRGHYAAGVNAGADPGRLGLSARRGARV